MKKVKLIIIIMLIFTLLIPQTVHAADPALYIVQKGVAYLLEAISDFVVNNIISPHNISIYNMLHQGQLSGNSSGNYSGGQVSVSDLTTIDIEESNGEKGIRSLFSVVIGQWYPILIKIAIIVFVLALVYIGVLTLISTSSTKRAENMQRLRVWAFGLVMLFGFSYVMVYLIQINNAIARQFLSGIHQQVEERYEEDLAEIEAKEAFDVVNVVSLAHQASDGKYTNADVSVERKDKTLGIGGVHVHDRGEKYTLELGGWNPANSEQAIPSQYNQMAEQGTLVEEDYYYYVNSKTGDYKIDVILFQSAPDKGSPLRKDDIFAICLHRFDFNKATVVKFAGGGAAAGGGIGIFTGPGAIGGVLIGGAAGTVVGSVKAFHDGITRPYIFENEGEEFSAFLKVFKSKDVRSEQAILLSAPTDPLLRDLYIEYHSENPGNLGYAALYFIGVIQTLWLFVVYFIRVFMVAFLILIFPLVMAIYCLDKINDNKSSHFAEWFKEFVSNVFTNSVHALSFALIFTVILYDGGGSAAGVSMLLATPAGAVEGSGHYYPTWLRVFALFMIIPSGQVLRAIFKLEGKGAASSLAGVGAMIGGLMLAGKTIDSVRSGVAGVTGGIGEIAKERSKLTAQNKGLSTALSKSKGGGSNGGGSGGGGGGGDLVSRWGAYGKGLKQIGGGAGKVVGGAAGWPVGVLTAGAMGMDVERSMALGATFAVAGSGAGELMGEMGGRAAGGAGAAGSAAYHAKWKDEEFAKLSGIDPDSPAAKDANFVYSEKRAQGLGAVAAGMMGEEMGRVTQVGAQYNRNKDFNVARRFALDRMSLQTTRPIKRQVDPSSGEAIPYSGLAITKVGPGGTITRVANSEGRYSDNSEVIHIGAAMAAAKDYENSLPLNVHTQMDSSGYIESMYVPESHIQERVERLTEHDRGYYTQQRENFERSYLQANNIMLDNYNLRSDKGLDTLTRDLQSNVSDETQKAQIASAVREFSTSYREYHNLVEKTATEERKRANAVLDEMVKSGTVRSVKRGDIRKGIYTGDVGNYNVDNIT